jgi:hypothetical protein
LKTSLLKIYFLLPSIFLFPFLGSTIILYQVDDPATEFVLLMGILFFFVQLLLEVCFLNSSFVVKNEQLIINWKRQRPFIIPVQKILGFESRIIFYSTWYGGMKRMLCLTYLSHQKRQYQYYDARVFWKKDIIKLIRKLKTINPNIKTNLNL